MSRSAALWLAAGWIGFALLPWYLQGETRSAGASALVLGLRGDASWLLPLALPLLAFLPALRWQRSDPRLGLLMAWAGLAGLAWLVLQGAAIDHRGWTLQWLDAFGSAPVQRGMGYGAL